MDVEMAGKVYLANVTASVANYSVNNAQIGTPGRPINTSTYVPYFVFAGRTKYPERGTFAYGPNAFSASFADTIPPEIPQTDCQIQIPSNLSLDDDLLLYVFRSGVLLMTKRGVPLPPNAAFIPNAAHG